MKKTAVKVVMFVTYIVLFFTGCSSRVDLRDRAIVQAMGIDYKNGEFVITLQEFVPNDSGERGGESAAITVRGKTIFDALKNAESIDGKQIFYGHSRLFIIGKNTAKNSIFPIIEFLTSNYRLSLNASVLTSDYEAAEILSTDLFSKTVPDIIIDQIQNGGKTPDITVIDLLKNNYNLDGTCYMPVISKNENGVIIERCAVFSEHKSKIILDEKETMGLNLINGKVSDAVFSARCRGRDVSVNVTSNNTDVSIRNNGEKISLLINVSANGNITEFGIVKNEVISKKHIEDAERDMEQKIKECIEKTLNTVIKENNCDIFLLKQRLKNADNKLYQKIKEQPLSEWLPKIEYDVNVEFNIRHAGVQVN